MTTHNGGRKRLGGDFIGVTMKMPADLLQRIDHFAADEFGMSRADAISELLARGLASTALSAKEAFRLMDRAAKKGLAAK